MVPRREAHEEPEARVLLDPVVLRRAAVDEDPSALCGGHPEPFPSEKQGSQRRSGAPWVIDHLNVVGPAPPPLAAEQDVALFRRFEIMRF